jgi:hypothetical protein
MSAPPCPRCDAALEADDLRCPICGLLAPASALPDAGRVEAKLVRCGSCGAAVAWSAEARAPRCAYCGASARVETQPDPVEQAEATLPFRVDEARAKDALGAWLRSRGFFRPSDLASAAALESLKAVWWPAWRVDASALVSWTADSDAGSGHADWAPHAGQASMDFEGLLVPATRGLSAHECSALADAYDLASGQAAAAGPAGALCEPFEFSRSAGRSRIVAAVEHLARAGVERHEIPGVRRRNVHVVALLQGLAARRLSLPAWVLAYRYGGGLYRVVVHGQDPARVLGKAPLSWAKVLAVAGALLATLAAAAWFLARR